MPDVFSRKTRSRIMSRVRRENTQPEILVRQALHRMGYRFRLHRSELPGTPDIVLPRHGIVIFVHGCFWHRHPRCRFATTPQTRRAFWLAKFRSNRRRDRRVIAALVAAGWRVIVIWECQVSKGSPGALAKPSVLGARIAAALRRRTSSGLVTEL